MTNKHRDRLLEAFYLDEDDITIRRKKDGYRGRFKKHDKATIAYDKLGYGRLYIPTSGFPRGYKPMVLLHQLLILLRGGSIPEGYEVDHINGDPRDNSRENLRVVPHSINCRNKKLSSNNTTGYGGITKLSDTLYRIRRTIDGKRVSRCAPTLEKAVEVLEELKNLSSTNGYSERHGS